ncbi:MAG: Spy/CpxP family protein refolding chaperone [Cyanobacteria bacterium REEB67]|nr:Spy/CpxP family protein refolding chaperone [Cyanobacteria bacterium REEB67]
MKSIEALTKYMSGKSTAVSGANKGGVVLALTLSCFALGSYFLVPVALAGKNEGDQLIDADFEEAMLTHFEKRFFRTIDAGDEEKATLSAIFLKQMQSTRANRETLRDKMLELSDLIASADSSDEQIRSKLGEVKAAREKIMDARLDCALQVRQILTPEQRKIVGDRISVIVSGPGPLRKRLGAVVD